MKSPCWWMLIAAFTSRSIAFVPQLEQSQVRTLRGSLDFVATARAGFYTGEPRVDFNQMLALLLRLILQFFNQAIQFASAICLASLRFLSMFLNFSVSTTTWLSSMSCRDSLCWKSARALARRSCALANLIRAFARPLLPFWQRESAFCLRRRLARGWHARA